MLRISLFGVLRLEVDGEVVAAPSSRRARLLLAMLALDRRPHSRESLAARLWPQVLDESARTSLRTALVQLRSALGPDAARFLLVDRERLALTDARRCGPTSGSWNDCLRRARLTPRCSCEVRSC
jgi:DNA-binding SARP family transcriptional activator